MARRLPPQVGCAAPDDLVHERLAPEDLVHQHAHQVRRAPVDMHPQRRAWRQQMRQRLQARREHVEVRPQRAVPPVVVGLRPHHAPVGPAVEPRLVCVRRLRSERGVHVNEVHLAGQPLGRQRPRDVHRVAVHQSPRQAAGRQRHRALPRARLPYVPPSLDANELVRLASTRSPRLPHAARPRKTRPDAGFRLPPALARGGERARARGACHASTYRRAGGPLASPVWSYWPGSANLSDRPHRAEHARSRRVSQAG
jgi:hypothetical protein